jgi:hypothetical protein
MVKPDKDNTPPVDWPSVLAAINIRTAFLERIYEEICSHSSRLTEVPATSPDKQAGGFGKPLLERFFNSLTNPVGQRRLKQWFKFLLKANNLSGDSSRRQQTLKAKNLWEELCKLENKNFEQVVIDQNQLKRFYSLFKLLLGMCIMRPIIGDAPEKSSIYYSAIYHPLLDESTKQLILESVIVSPGEGSIGRCLRIGSNCISNSFADYAGVVEWQDLIQGNISILMVRVQTDTYEGNRKIPLSYIVMAFLPLTDVFNESNLLSDDVSGTLENLCSVENEECEKLIYVLGECAEKGMRYRLNDDDAQCVPPNNDETVTSRVTSVLLDYQDKWRTESMANKIFKAETEGVDKIASRIVDQLIPESFTDFPVPLAAAAAIIRNPSQPDQTKIAHLRATRRGLELAFNAIVPYQIAPKVAEKYPQHAADLLTQGINDRFLGTIRKQNTPAPSAIEFSHEVYSSDELYLGFDNEQFEAVWIIHTFDNEAAWVDGSAELAEVIHKPLSQILKIAETYAVWNSKEPNRWLDWLKDKVSSNAHNTSSIYGQLKLRDNLGERYYHLISRLLFASDDTIRQRYDELVFMLTICATPPGDEMPQHNMVSEACDAALELRNLLKRLGKSFLGTSSGVRIRHHLDWTLEEKNRAQSVVIKNLGQKVWNNINENFGYIRRLIHMLQIRGTLIRQFFPQDLTLDDEKERWKELFGGILRLSSTQIINETVNVNALLCLNKEDKKQEIDICCQVRPKFTFRTDLHPIHSRNLLNDWLSKRANTRQDALSKVESFLQIQLTSIPASESKTGDKLDAALYVGFNKSDLQAKELYLSKGQVIIKLFKEIMDERFQAIKDAERFAEEQGKLKAAESLISGLSHALKIPMQVAKEMAKEGRLEEVTRILEIAIPFVDVGAYIQNRERKKREGKQPKQNRLRPVSEEIHKDALIIRKSAVEEWFKMALEYVKVARKDGRIREIVEQLPDIESEAEQFINWKSDSPYALYGETGLILRRSPASGVFQAALLELFANAIAYANPDDPFVAVDVSAVSENAESFLLISIGNTCVEPPLKNSRELEYLMGKSGIVGLRTAISAIKALGWEVYPEVRPWNRQFLQVFNIKAPIDRENRYVQYFMD